MTNFELPGSLLDPETSSRIHKIFLYKFFRGSYAVKKTYFDRATMEFSTQKKWHFHTSGPYFTNDFKNFVTDRDIINTNLIATENNILIFEGGRTRGKKSPQFYCAEPEDVRKFFQKSEIMKLYSSDNLYIIGGRFDWFIHIRSSLKHPPRDDADYLYHLYSNKNT